MTANGSDSTDGGRHRDDRGERLQFSEPKPTGAGVYVENGHAIFINSHASENGGAGFHLKNASATFLNSSATNNQGDGVVVEFTIDPDLRRETLLAFADPSYTQDRLRTVASELQALAEAGEPPTPQRVERALASTPGVWSKIASRLSGSTSVALAAWITVALTAVTALIAA